VLEIGIPPPKVGIFPIVRGALWMTAATAGFAVVMGLIRYLSEGMHVLEIIFFRNLFGLIAIMPLFWKVRIAGLRTQRLGLYCVRSASGLLAMLGAFYAVTMIPLSDAIALGFSAPLFITIGAVFVLGEVVRARRWIATLIGFAGALIVLRPGFGVVEPGALLALFGAVAMSVSMICVKLLSQTERPQAIVAWMTLLLTPASLVPALFVWHWPSFDQWPWLVALGAAATFGHFALTHAYAVVDASVVQPFDFLRLPFVGLVGYLAFSQTPDIWTWVGGTIIFLSVIFIAHRESRSKDRTAPRPASKGEPPDTL